MAPLQRTQVLSLSTSIRLGRPSVEPISDGVLPFGILVFIVALCFLHAPHECLKDFVVECLGRSTELLSCATAPVLPELLVDCMINHSEGRDVVGVRRHTEGLVLKRNLRASLLQSDVVQQNVRNALGLLIQPGSGLLPLQMGLDGERQRGGAPRHIISPRRLHDGLSLIGVKAEGLELGTEFLDYMLVLGSAELLLPQGVEQLAVDNDVALACS